MMLPMPEHDAGIHDETFRRDKGMEGMLVASRTPAIAVLRYEREGNAVRAVNIDTHIGRRGGVVGRGASDFPSATA